MAVPIALEVFPQHRTLPPATASTSHVLFRVRAVETETAPKRPRLSAVLILDVSGSMRGDPLRHVVHSAQRVAKLLAADDRVGVVSFSDGAMTLAPLAPLTDEHRRTVTQSVEHLRASGQTNMAGALAHAALLFPPRAPGEQQIALLLSDGQPNVGPSSKDALADQASLLKARDVAVSTLGYGIAHGEEVMSAIANAAGGRYAFVIDPHLAESAFIRALGAQLDVVAEGVELVLAPQHGVEIIRVLDDPKTAIGARGLVVSLPDLLVGDELNVVVEVRVKTPQEPGPFRMIEASLEARPAGVKEPFAVKLLAALSVSATLGIEIDRTANDAVIVAETAVRRAKARALADVGRTIDAIAMLEAAKKIVEESPGYVDGGTGSLFDVRETLVDDIAGLKAAPSGENYERSKKAGSDYLDFSTSGAKRRGASLFGKGTPSALLLARALAGSNGPIPRGYLREIDGPYKGRRIPLKERVMMGRSFGNDIVLADANVTRRHALVEFVDGAFHVVDLGSTNGVLLSGRRVARAKLDVGTAFSVGMTTFRYEEDK